MAVIQTDSPLLRMAWRDARREWRRSVLTSAAVVLPVGIGAYLGPALIGIGPLSLIMLLVFSIVIALSVGAVIAVSTKRRVVRYGRLSAIGAGPGQIKKLLFMEAVPPAFIGYLVGMVAGSSLSLWNGPYQWFFDDGELGDDGIALISSFPSLVHLLLGLVSLYLAVATGIGVWFAAAPAAQMALHSAVVESLAARAPEPEPRRFQGRIGLAVIVTGFGFCLVANEFFYSLLMLAVLAVFVGLHLVIAPLLLALERYSDRFPMFLRLAVRNGARNRTRLGRLTFASLATVALGVMAAAGIASDSPDNPSSGRSWPMDQRFVLVAEPPGGAGLQDAELVRETINISAEAAVNYVETSLQLVHSRRDGGYSTSGLSVAVFTPELVAALDPDDETLAALDRGEIILASGTSLSVTGNGRDPMDPEEDFITHSARLGFGESSRVVGGSGHISPLALVSQQTADVLGARERPAERVRLYVADRPVTQREREALADGLEAEAFVTVTDAVSANTFQLVVVGLAAALSFFFGLIGTALSGMETDGEVATMIANGGRPSLRRWFRCAQAAMQMFVAGLVGAPLGVMLFWAVTRTDDSVPSAIYPLEAMIVLGLVVPLVVVVAVAAITPAGTPAVSRRAMV